MRTLVQVSFVLLICFLKSVSLEQHDWNKQFTVTFTVCKTDECFDEAVFLVNSMDTRLNPCDDFYAYVCTNWEKRYANPVHYPEWSVDSKMGEKSFNQLRLILEEQPSSSESLDLINAKIFFKECMELPHLDLYDSALIGSYVRGAGYFPIVFDSNAQKKSWMEVHNYYIRLTGESGLFDLTLRNNVASHHRPTIHLSEPTSPFGLFIPTESFTLKQLRNYETLLVAILKHVIIKSTRWKSYSLIEKDLMDVLVFRRELYSMKGEHFMTDKSSSLMTVNTLDTWYHELSKKYKSTSHISWNSVIGSLYRNLQNVDKTKSMMIVVENKLYFRLLAHFLHKTPEHVIVNHINLYFIERHLKMNEHLKSMMMNVITKNGKLTGAVRYIGKRWHLCISMNEAKDALNVRYVHKYFPRETKEKAEHLVKELKTMMRQQIEDSTWLNDYTKDKADRLIADMKSVIGYPEFYDDWSKKIEFLKRKVIEPTKIDAIYSPYTNSLSVSVAYLNIPLFSPKLPDAVSYGAMGANIAHELYHAFGPTHIRRQEREYCWSPAMVEEYQNKTKCFVKQFDRIPVVELANIIPIPTIDGNSTLGENIADTMGLKLAYETFRKKLWMKRKCETLPTLAGIDCHKLFFISFAMSFCSAQTTDGMLEQTEMGLQSTPRLRVNGAVSNMKEFSKLFQCPEKAPLNPRERCDLWQ